MLLRRRRKGQAIVEMAFLFPFFLLIIAGGIVDFGFAFYNFIRLQQIANDAAQYAVEGYYQTHDKDAPIPGTSVIGSYVLTKKPRWWVGNLTVEKVDVVNSSDGQAKIAKVFVRYDSQVYTPFYQTLMGQVTGHKNIPLRVLSAYQRPVNVGG